MSLASYHCSTPHGHDRDRRRGCPGTNEASREREPPECFCHSGRLRSRLAWGPYFPSGGPPSRRCVGCCPRSPEPACVLSVPGPLAPACAFGGWPSSFFSCVRCASFSLVCW